MNIIKRKLQERRSKKSLTKLREQFEIWKTVDRPTCESGKIYKVEGNEQRALNTLDDIFDKHHGW